MRVQSALSIAFHHFAAQIIRQVSFPKSAESSRPTGANSCVTETHSWMYTSLTFTSSAMIDQYFSNKVLAVVFVVVIW